jgi:hypothetical protein
MSMSVERSRMLLRLGFPMHYVARHDIEEYFG